MALDRLPDLDPDEGTVIDEELAYFEDVLVKVFAFGPNATLEPHAHEGSTNVFHVVEGEVVVVQDDVEERVTAPGVVVHEPGAVHGARNETDQRAVLTATFAPSPG
ncbi:Cupin domain containing protein [Halanaeroarchaeum sp. HSR-CO]|uniref:cupin domain-containing protein n=1 Tax=Halanaeroarchaeum sp. HSR-CO TaxID=2866382 RepID=UPI00217D0129|nr:cupin domain-containing protein [Halanaeroarchaeum sp. HSR-CO]UWG48773.1 Cupin domain containing protein [Halanaeroarchaeum sp. HSR-CO]